MSEQTDKMDRALRRIRGLIANADDPANPEAARESYRQQAEALMFKYRVDEATMVATGQFGDSEGGMKPVWRTIALTSMSSEFERYYRTIGATCAQHVGARARFMYEYKDDGHIIVMNAVGYESDLRYMDLLMTSALIEFGKRLEPKHDPNLSFDENAYAMRSAGMERKRIAKILLGEWATENEMKAKNRRITAAVKREAERLGEDWHDLLGRGNNMETFRASYAESFVNTLYARLYRMRSANGEESAALVLADRSERVDEAFYERYPNLRPGPARDYVDPRKGCQKCERAQSGYCRDHQYLKPSNAQVRIKHSSAGASRGRTAALMVDLGGKSGTPRAPRVDRKEIG